MTPPRKSNTNLSDVIDYQAAHSMLEEMVTRGPKEFRELARFRLVELEIRFLVTHSDAIADLIDEKSAGISAALRAAGAIL